MYDVEAGAAWRPGPLSLFRWVTSGAQHAPDSPWWGVARFGAGEHKTLYLAASPEGAMAEFFRRFPEFLNMQGDLSIALFRVDVDVACDCLDVRNPDQADAVGIPFDRLLSSEADETIRYSECRELAKEAIAAGRCGLTYPSAAATWDTWNLVLFGDPGPWTASGHMEVARPRMAAADVNPLPST